ncbi:MAG: adenosine kinase [Acidimicrobiales bacterium]
MSDKTYDVVGLGSAIVDAITHADDAFVEEWGIDKGGMTLIDEQRAHLLYDAMGPAAETSGGSAANTVAGVASFGGRAAFIGTVRDDQLGEIFRHDIRACGVDFDVPAGTEGPSTARCLILVTPDAQRSMSTYLGISSLVDPASVDEALVASSKVVYCEGYLWDMPQTIEAIKKAFDRAREAGGKVAFALSDDVCVDRHRADYLQLVDERVDLLFANADEIRSLYEVDDFEDAIEAVRGRCEIAVLTCSADGSVVVTADETLRIPAEPTEVLDTTGAGDLYAAGFIYGYTQGLDLATCARLGSAAAAEVISHLGARPQVPLTEIVDQILVTESAEP